MRVALVAAWIALQAALVLTGSKRADAAFAFRMFPESSTISISLSRELATGVTVPIEEGRWVGHDAQGVPHDLAWSNRVKDPILSSLGQANNASYGVDAQLSRLQAALDDVSLHLEGDAETRAIIATVTVRKNGHDPYVVALTSKKRP